MSKKYEFPYTFTDLTEDEENLVKYSQIFGGLKKVVPTKYCCPRRMEKYGSELFNFEPRKDDIWLIGFPRCGTTLLQEILYLLGTDLNYEKAAATIMDERFPYLEHVLLRGEADEILYQNLLEQGKQPSTPDEQRVVPYHVKLTNSKEKRFIKSHMGFDFVHPMLLEVGCKVVFITRNIKDCLVSNHHYPDKLNKEINEDENIHRMFKSYRQNLTIGNYFELLKAAWKRRHNENLLFLFYEEVNADKRKAVLKIADFLGKKLTEEQLDRLLDHITVENFKNNKSLNNDHLVDAGVYVKTEKYSFIRQGKSGGWRDIFKKEMNDEFNLWIIESLKEIPDFEMPECWKKAMDL